MFTVTRQIRWPDGVHIVEVSAGGIDYCNPDALCSKYSGEFEEFIDPRDAVETAINIAQAWQKDSSDEIFIGMGATHGMTAQFDELELTEQNCKLMHAQAVEIYEKLPKCDGCGEPIEKEWKRVDDWTGEVFCSEQCVERAVEFDEEVSAELEDE